MRVSVPLRGKKIETNNECEWSIRYVSVPLRGKKIETLGFWRACLERT